MARARALAATCGSFSKRGGDAGGRFGRVQANDSGQCRFTTHRTLDAILMA